MGSHNAISELRDSQNGASDHESPAPELRFNGFNAGDHEVSGSETVTDLKSRDFAGKFDSGVGSNLARYKSMSPASLPIVRSPCLTIPPGLSPTALLDSPVLLSNMHAEPSPTTGTFSLPLSRHDGGLDPFPSPRDASNNRSNQDGSPNSFVFKPHVGSCSTSGLPSVGSLASHSYNYQQYSHLAQAQGQYQAKSLASLPSVKNEQVTASAHELYLSVKAPDPPPLLVTSRALVPAEVATDEQRQRHGSHSDAQALQFDYKGPGPLTVIERPSEDGYNWRKYGQKQVKGSEYPRSYYKCTHPNCQMKKQLERSHDGQITEIIYKGTHDHPKPQPSRRLAVGAVLGSQEEERLEGFCSLNNTDDKLSNGHGLASNHMDSNGNIELSCVSASDDDGEGLAVQPNNMDIEVEEDDPESKRRKQEFGVVDATPISRAPREPRVVVQTVSEVDILDDGYRWRKYGQKVVKGNPNPRSYYKCTNAGCPVRKHVERASHDPKAVITTYEGKHNHDVPTARINSHETAGSLITPNINIIKDPRSISYYESPDQKDAISLDLGVGIGQSPENGSMEKQQIPDSGQVSQIPGSSCNNLLEVTPISSFYGGLYGNRDGFGSREDQGEGFSFKSMALNHSSNKYHQNMGSLLMGP